VLVSKVEAPMRRLWPLMLAFPLTASADEVMLRGGGRVVGVVLEESSERVVLETGPGRVAVGRANVLSVKRSSSDLAEWSERARQLSDTDLAGWLALGLWAQGRGLETQARVAFQRVLALDPANAVAHAGLGHVLEAGRYMTTDEAHRSRGEVLYQGEWMSAAERADRQRTEAEERAAFRARVESVARAREAEARAREAEAAAQAAASASSSVSDGLPWGWGGGWGYSPMCYGTPTGTSCVGGSYRPPYRPHVDHRGQAGEPRVAPAPAPPPTAGFRSQSAVAAPKATQRPTAPTASLR
jgi:hypothetical protein